MNWLTADRQVTALGLLVLVLLLLSLLLLLFVQCLINSELKVTHI